MNAYTHDYIQNQIRMHDDTILDESKRIVEQAEYLATMVSRIARTMTARNELAASLSQNGDGAKGEAA